LMHLWHGPGFRVTSNEVMDATMERARAAIAKATGAPE